MSTPAVFDGKVGKHSNATSAKCFSFVLARQMKPKLAAMTRRAVTNQRTE